MWALIFGGAWLVGAILYGGYLTRKEGDESSALAEALIWPIALVVRLAQTREEPEDK